MRNLLIRLGSMLTFITCLTLGLRAGYTGVFSTYGLIAPKATLIISEIPILIIVAYVLLLLFSISLGGYLVYKISLFHTELFVGKQFIKNSILSLVAGLAFSFGYWSLLQIVAILFLINR